MYTQHSKIKMGVNGPVAEPLDGVGPTVKLIAQGGDHNVTFVDAGGEVQILPSHLFFMTHREATPDEIDGFVPPALKVKGPKEAA